MDAVVSLLRPRFPSQAGLLLYTSSILYRQVVAVAAWLHRSGYRHRPTSLIRASEQSAAHPLRSAVRNPNNTGVSLLQFRIFLSNKGIAAGEQSARTTATQKELVHNYALQLYAFQILKNLSIKLKN
ncbi:hypothetical protein L1887_39227 [Cichorium endivia]|nr:hypothetical protein L1887_39227 [Cichorium endivia]